VHEEEIEHASSAPLGGLASASRNSSGGLLRRDSRSVSNGDTDSSALENSGIDNGGRGHPASASDNQSGQVTSQPGSITSATTPLTAEVAVIDPSSFGGYYLIRLYFFYKIRTYI